MNICNIIKHNIKQKKMIGENMFNKYNKSIVINKSQYSRVNDIIKEGYLQRINKLTHDVKIVENEHNIKLIVTPIEEV